MCVCANQSVNSDHLKNLTPDVDSGFWKMGGALLEEVPKDGEALKIFGSVMLANAATKEQVIEQLKKDIYFKSKVWDFEKVRFAHTIRPNGSC
jgi:hypothetical protein